MIRISAAAVLACWCCLLPTAQAVDYTWGNAAGGNWNVAGNWGGGIPGVNDNAALNALAGSYTVLVTDNRSVNNFDLNYANATLTVTGNWTVAGTASIDLGTFNLNSGSMTVNGVFVTDSSGTSNWNGGILQGTGTLYGVLNVFSSANELRLAGLTLKNAGTIAWSSGEILAYFGTTAALTNLSSGVIDFKADGLAFKLGTGATGTIIHQSSATIRKSAGTGAGGTSVEWAVNFQDNSNVDVQTGTLKFIGGGTFPDGTINLTGAGTAALADGTFTVPLGSTFTAPANSGNPLNFTFGSLTVNGTLTGTLKWTGGILGGGSVTTPGILAGTINVFTDTPDRRISGTKLQNSGTIAWNSGTMIAYESTTALLTNISGGVIDFKANGNSFMLGTGATGTLVNENGGTLRKSGGTGTTNFEWAVDLRSGSTIDAQTGTLRFIGGGTLPNGTINLTGAGTAVLADGNFTIPNGSTFTAPANGGNSLRFDNGTLTATGALAGNIIWTGGYLAGNSLTGTIAVIDGTNDQNISTQTLQNSGTINWTSGPIFAYSGTNAKLTNILPGIIDLMADGTAFVFGSGASGILDNNGLFRKTGGTGAGGSTVVWTFTNSGTIQVTNAGRLNFSGGVTNTGTVTMASGATIGGTINSNSGGFVKGPATTTGTYSGALTFATGSTLQPGGGSAGRLNLSSTLNMSSGSTYSVKLSGTTAITGYSQVSVTGLTTLTNPTLSIDTTGYVPDPAAKYFIMLDGNASPITGTFNGLPNGSTVNFGGYSGKINYTGVASTGALTGGRDVVIYNVVPEPTGVLTAGFAASGLFAAFRRLRRGK